MASRIMHLIIADGVNKQLGIDHEDFYWGNILPDAYKNGQKDITHFRKPNSILGSENLLDPEAFINTYKQYMQQPLYKGYYAHLISDQIWLNRIYNPIMINSQGEIRKEICESYYDDYYFLNPILLKEYPLKRKLFCKSNLINMKEISIEAINGIHEGLVRDMNQESTQKPLKLMKLDTIKDYIHDSIEQVIHNLQRF